MKRIFVFAGLFVLLAVIACSLRVGDQVADAQKRDASQTTDTKISDKRTPVLVELFTSEGCLNCLPADANLAFFEREQPFLQAEIIALELHVDYWNSLDWKDKYSSPIFSRRQQLYSAALKLDSKYTPQMVVDGREEFIGSSLAKAQKAILDAAKNPKANIEITPAADKYEIKISGVPAHESATVFLAITEDNLPYNIKRGEKLQHTSVVRELSSLGMLNAGQNGLELETALQIQPEWKKENLKFVVFVQENISRKVLGVNRKSLN